MPLHLPRYVFRRANGSFRYKRNVPERLRPLIGKATLYRQLGDSYREAMQALPLVHARIEALLNDEANKSAKERSLEIIRGALGNKDDMLATFRVLLHAFDKCIHKFI